VLEYPEAYYCIFFAVLIYLFLFMQNIQEVFNQIQEVKKQQKTIKTAFRDALNNSGEYKKLVDDLKVMKESKKVLEQSIKEEFKAELDKLDDLKIDLETQNMMLNDIALTKIMNGESIEVVDMYNNAYEPIFSVKFKKTNVIKEEEQKMPAAKEDPVTGQTMAFEINHSLE